MKKTNLILAVSVIAFLLGGAGCWRKIRRRNLRTLFTTLTT
jgi:hypothetical protein